MAPDTVSHVAAIYADARWVRHYERGGRLKYSPMAIRRHQAILKLGLTVRHAFSQSDDFEALLTALVDGLHSRDDPPF